jgi:hypothetical protein
MVTRSAPKLLAATILALCLLVPTASAANLKDTATGLAIKAPSGYKLKFANGVFTLKGPNRYVQFMSFRSPFGVKQTGDVVLAGIKAKKVKNRKVSSKRFQATAKVKNRAVTIRLLTTNGVTQLAIFGGKGGGKASSVALDRGSATPIASTSALSGAEVASLEKILRSRTGEPVQDINIGIPTKKFTAPVNNGASADVPDLPGWQYSGTDTGYLVGGSADGGFELGGFIFVNYPTAPFPAPQFPTAPLTAPAQALVNVFPKWKQISGAGTITFQQINPLTGTDGNLGTGFVSQAFEVLMTMNGMPVRGVFNVGVTDNAGSFLTWGFYFSYAVERINGPSGILNALLGTWGSWNNSAASIARLESAVKTIQSTRPAGGGGIDPAVFQKAADSWDEYIRGPK